MSMAKPLQRLVFVYGTLKRGQVNYPYWMVRPDIEFVCGATTVRRYPLVLNLPEFGSSPCLLDEPDYPGALNVSGEVFALKSSEAVELLDRLEAVAAGLYTKITVDVIPQQQEQQEQQEQQQGTMAVTAYVRTGKFPLDTWKALVLPPTHGHINAAKEEEDQEPVMRMLANFDVATAIFMQKGCYHYMVPHLIPERQLSAPPTSALRRVIGLILIDGCGDVSCDRKTGFTPLQRISHTSSGGGGALNTIAKNGICGLMDPVRQGFSCGSDTAHLNLLGYDPLVFYRGRGAFEAIGAGVEMGTGDIAFKCNFATLDESSGIILQRRCDRNFEAEGPILCEIINGTQVKGPGVVHEHWLRVKYATEHRCGVVITGPHLSDRISGTDPLKDGFKQLACVPQPGHENDPAAVYTCHVVNAASQSITHILMRHKVNAERRQQGKALANTVLLRGAALRNEMPSFTVRHGLRGSIIAPTCIIRGLGACVGMTAVHPVPGATGDYHSDYMAKADAFLRTMRQGDSEFIFLHIKGVDDAGHEKDLAMKEKLLRSVDKMLAYLWDRVDDGVTLAITGDHSTPIAIGDHCCEPVPFAVATKGLTEEASAESSTPHIDLPLFDDVERFDELACRCGALGRFAGANMMDVIKTYHCEAHRKILLFQDNKTDC